MNPRYIFLFLFLLIVAMIISIGISEVYYRHDLRIEEVDCYDLNNNKIIDIKCEKEVKCLDRNWITISTMYNGEWC